MSSHRAIALLFVALAPGAAVGQAPDHDKVEIIKPPEGAPPPAPAPDLAKVVARVVERTNQFRKDQGRSAVAVHDKLTAAAQAFADYMAQTGRYGHTADGTTPGQRVKAAGYEFSLVGENIAYAYRGTAFTAEELAKVFQEGWENSPGHRKNMLDPDMTELGVAVARSAESGYFFAVQLFARPKALAVEFQITNETTATVHYRVEDQKFDLAPRYGRTHSVGRPPAVTLLVPGDGGQTKDGPAVRPKGGEKYAVRASPGGALTLTPE